MEPFLWLAGLRPCGQVLAPLAKEPRQCFPPPGWRHGGLVRDEVSGIARCYLDTLPSSIGPQVGRAGVSTRCWPRPAGLIQVLEKLEALGVGRRSAAGITAIVASPGLKTLGEAFPQLHHSYSGRHRRRASDDALSDRAGWAMPAGPPLRFQQPQI